MELKKYNILIERIAKGLQDGTLKTDDIEGVLEAELGPINKSNTQTYQRMSPEEHAQWREEQTMKRETRELHKAIITYWQCVSAIENSPEPFTIKAKAPKLLAQFEIIRTFKEHPYYHKALVDAIKWVDEGMPDITLKPEYIHSLSTKHL